MPHRHSFFRAVPVALSLSLALGAGGARGVEVGRVLEDMALRRADGGGPAALFERGATATVAVFFRPEQDRSRETLGEVARCETARAKGVRWLAVASGGTAPDAMPDAVAAAGQALTVVLDDGDALYARVGVRTLPAIVILDRDRRVASFEPYHPVGLCANVTARVRHALGEIDDAAVARAVSPPTSEMPGVNPLGVAARHVSFGRKLLAAGSLKQAHDSARKSLEIAPSAAAWSLEGEIFNAEGRCDDARRSFDAALALDPRDAAALAGREGCRR